MESELKAVVTGLGRVACGAGNERTRKTKTRFDEEPHEGQMGVFR
jgi:hypothetical protein